MGDGVTEESWIDDKDELIGRPRESLFFISQVQFLLLGALEHK